MANRRSNFSNAFEAVLTTEVGPSGLTFEVGSTFGAPASPCYLVIDPDDNERREYVYFDGEFDATSLSSSSLSNRYLEGSAQVSGITHGVGAVVRSVATAQGFEDVHDRIDAAEQAIEDIPIGGGPGEPGPGGGDIPAGVIVMWSGSTGAVPNGWALCNGGNGTPDLRDRFIVGAGDTYDPGATGGANTVTLTQAQMPSHSHSVGSHSHGAGTLSASNAGAHTHSIAGTRLPGEFTPNNPRDHSHPSTTSFARGFGPVTGAEASNGATGSGGAHVHTISGTTGAATGATAATGSGNAHENRPPYYALAFIMKLGS